MTPEDLEDTADAFADLAKTATAGDEHVAAAIYHLGAAVMHVEADLARRLARLERKVEERGSRTANGRAAELVVPLRRHGSGGLT